MLRPGRVERRRRLVEQQNVGLGGKCPRYAEALLLAARKRERAVPQPIFHLVPQGGPAQRPLDGGIHLGEEPATVDPQPRRDVVVDRQRPARNRRTTSLITTSGTDQARRYNTSNGQLTYT